MEQRVRSVMRLSLAAALPIGVVWLVVEAQDIAGASTLAETVVAILDVLLHTSFGHVLALQSLAIAGALAATAVMRWPSLLSVGLAGLAVLLEAAHGHGFAMADTALLISQALHLLASGAWLGALMPLLIVVRDTSLATAALAARRFATLGSISVAVLVTTALYQGLVLSGGLEVSPGPLMAGC